MTIYQRKVELIKELLDYGVLELSPNKTSIRSIRLWELLKHPKTLLKITQELACRMYNLHYDQLSTSHTSCLPILVSLSLELSRPCVFSPVEWSFIFDLVGMMSQSKNNETLVMIEPSSDEKKLAAITTLLQLSGVVITDVIALFELPSTNLTALESRGITVQTVFEWETVLQTIA